MSRHPVEANPDGRLFARFHLDVGMGDVQREPCEWNEPRDWLGFAGIAAGRFQSISREEHFAQMVHAYTSSMGGRAKTRVKDLISLVLFVDSGTLDQERLSQDHASTFARRNTHALTNELETPPDFWKQVFEKLAAECGIDGDIQAPFGKVNRYISQLP